MLKFGSIFTNKDLKYSTVMKSVHGVTVLAIRPSANSFVFVGRVIKDESIAKRDEGAIIDICFLSIFGKYDQEVELNDGTIVKNVY